MLMVILGLYRDNGKKMETTIVYWGNIGVPLGYSSVCKPSFQFIFHFLFHFIPDSYCNVGNDMVPKEGDLSLDPNML